MQRRKFMTAAILTANTLSANAKKIGEKAQKDWYELREYEMRFGVSQSSFDNYLKNALIPALNKFGVKNVGVFQELNKPEPAKIYVLIPYPSIEEYASISEKVKNDADFKKNSLEFNNILPDKIPYARYKSSFMTAFEGLPKIIVPKSEPRIFEMRTYESFSEDALRRKVKMFNESELALFDRVKLNSVFFGEVVSGERMPCLTYFITFKNMEERDANWKAFSVAPEWKQMSTAPEYANAMNRIIKTFLEPLAYSQI